MTTITIPKNLIKNDDLIILPRSEYDKIINFFPGDYKEVSLTISQKRKIQKARQNLSRGKFITINELRNKLGA